MRDEELDKLVDRALKRLPAPRAPRTLVPSVMAAIEAGRVRQSSARPWLSWPLAWQVASLAVLVVLALGIARLWPDAQQAVQRSISSAFAGVPASVADAAGTASVVASVTRAVWRGLVEPFVGYALALVLVMCLACATFGAALGRVALGGVSQT
jgi:hypothetical protein